MCFLRPAREIGLDRAALPVERNPTEHRYRDQAPHPAPRIASHHTNAPTFRYSQVCHSPCILARHCSVKRVRQPMLIDSSPRRSPGGTIDIPINHSKIFARLSAVDIRSRVRRCNNVPVIVRSGQKFGAWHKTFSSSEQARARGAVVNKTSVSPNDLAIRARVCPEDRVHVSPATATRA